MQITLMEKLQCLGGILDNRYAAPLPLIGLYITTATLVCLLLIISDVYLGYRQKKPWLPCKYFSLNSLTLSLLAIATKVPFDLTTPMPSPQDQLSKLCGTTLICISMGFFLPCVANMEGSELFVNMASLTILVVTVIVNACIQMATGVIFSLFFVEHIIILLLMMLILIIMWYFTFYSRFMADAFREIWREQGKYAYGVELGYREGLELHFKSISIYNHQLRVCSIAHYPAVGLLCTISPLLLLEVAFRTFFLKHLRFCDEVSDYKWSVWIVVVSQIITLVLGTLAITFRLFFVASQLNPFKPEEDASWIEWSCDQFQAFKVFSKLLLNWKIFSGIMKTCQVLEDIVIHVLFATEIGLNRMDKVVIFLTRGKLISGSKRNATDYLGENATADLTSWRKKCREDEPRRLIHLLSRNHPSQESRTIEGTNNCLLLVILVRLSDILLPSEFSRPLVDALDEAFSMIYFADKRLDSLGFSNRHRRRLAKDLWMTRDISNHWFRKTVINPLQMKYPQVKKNISLNGADFHTQFVPNHPIQVIKELGQLLNRPLFFDSDERLIIKDFIEDGRYGTFKELYERMEQLFVDKVSLFLTELPNVALEYVLQSPARKQEKRMRIALQFMYKFEQLQSQVQWLSVGNNVASKRSANGSEPVEGNKAAVGAPPAGTADVSTHVHVANGDAIIEVH